MFDGKLLLRPSLTEHQKVLVVFSKMLTVNS